MPTEVLPGRRNIRHVQKGVNLKTSGTTTLFTTRAGGARFYITDIFILLSSVTGLLTPATVQVGIDSPYLDISAAMILTDLTTAGNFFRSSLGGVATGVCRSVAPGTAIVFNIAAAATGTTVLGDVIIEGFYQ